MKRRTATFILLTGALTAVVPVLAASQSDDRNTLGLKDALRVATENAISSTGKLNGYFKNKAIKILMPKELSPIEKVLRTFGQSGKVDEFVKSMNRSAERAAPQAGKFFTDAIKALTFDDARKILTGGDTAATDFFQRKTGGKIAESFAPIVKTEMDKVGVARQFKDLTEKAKSLPFGEGASIDIDKYVVDKAVSGLFTVMGEEERKIRRDPVARVTDILKDVFGNLR